MKVPKAFHAAQNTPFSPGMIVSNEPGYYATNQFGIRIENLIYVKPATQLSGADDREMLEFETLTMAPIDHAMIDLSLLENGDRDWLNTYHAKVLKTLSDRISPDALTWLKTACAPL